LKFDKRSLGIKIWGYFALFSAVIMILIWLLQTVFLSSFYASMKTKTIEAAAAEIAQMYGKADFEGTIDRIAYKNSILIYVTDQNGNLLYTSDEHGGGGRQNGFGGKPSGNQGGEGNPAGRFGGQRPLPIDYSDFLNRLSQSGKASVSYKVKQDNFLGETLIYGLKLDESVLYISSPIEALDATTGILRTQLIYITAIALLLGFVIAFFISRKLSKPITKITNTASRLAQGDYSVRFEKGYYSEIDALSATLNYTAHELSKVESLRRELIANISHDLRTPLTMIKGYTEMIEEVSANDKEKRTKHLSIIKEETARLEGLVGDILQLSLLQSGNESISPQNVNLSETVKAVLSRFAMLSEHEGYAIHSQIEHDLYVFADKSRIEQVLYNLIGNALNYAGEDKALYAKLIDLGGYVRFEVQDKGVGIAEDELPYIWERYYKSKERSRSKTSTGIGLSIVKSILLLHDAKFGVDSTVGIGSTFWFELKK
jgi:signal transduction histidine kinase